MNYFRTTTAALFVFGVPVAWFTAHDAVLWGENFPHTSVTAATVVTLAIWATMIAVAAIRPLGPTWRLLMAFAVGLIATFVVAPWALTNARQEATMLAGSAVTVALMAHLVAWMATASMKS